MYSFQSLSFFLTLASFVLFKESNPGLIFYSVGSKITQPRVKIFLVNFRGRDDWLLAGSRLPSFSFCIWIPVKAGSLYSLKLLSPRLVPVPLWPFLRGEACWSPTLLLRDLSSIIFRLFCRYSPQGLFYFTKLYKASSYLIKPLFWDILLLIKINYYLGFIII